MAVVCYNRGVGDRVGEPVPLHRECAKGVYLPCTHVAIDLCKKRTREGTK